MFRTSNTTREARYFYENYVRPLIHERFPEYEGRIAVGLAGEGSECFGFDDLISRDHDFGRSFCMWLTQEDYSIIGPQLQGLYEEAGGDRAGRLRTRRGVMTLSDHFRLTTGKDFQQVIRNGGSIPEELWMRLAPEEIAAAVNGEIFRDDLGLMSAIRRNLLAYYPERIRLMRLVNSLHSFSANAQANYPRCMARGDQVTADICRAEGIQAAMDTVFLLQKVYGPYYKWKFRTLERLEESGAFMGISQLLKRAAAAPDQSFAWNGYEFDATKINQADEYCRLMEEVAAMISRELLNRGLTDRYDPFLEYHCLVIGSRIR